MPKIQASLIGLLLAVLIGIITVIGTYFTVDPYERGIVTRAGNFAYVAEPGLHFKVPFLDSVTKRRIDVQTITTPQLNTYTVDNQEVDAVLVIQYVVPPEELSFIYANVGELTPLLQTMTADRWKIEAGKINVSNFASTRGILINTVKTIVATEAKRLYHVTITDVQLFNLDYQKSYRDAQAQAAVVKTQIEQSQGLQEKAKIDAETARVAASGQANQAIEAARGSAERVRIDAIAQAEAVRVNAIAQAEAMRVQAIAASEAARIKGIAEASVIKAVGDAEAGAKEAMANAISVNSGVVEYLKASRWDGKLPVSMYAGAPIPFLPMAAR